LTNFYKVLDKTNKVWYKIACCTKSGAMNKEVKRSLKEEVIEKK